MELYAVYLHAYSTAKLNKNAADFSVVNAFYDSANKRDERSELARSLGIGSARNNSSVLMSKSEFETKFKKYLP